MAAAAQAAPQPTSLTSMREPLTFISSRSSMALAICLIISSGATSASFVHFSSCSSRVGSSLGMPYAWERGKNAAASSSTSSSRRARTASPSSSILCTSASYSAYFFFPVVKLPTMEHSATESAPT